MSVDDLREGGTLSVGWHFHFDLVPVVFGTVVWRWFPTPQPYVVHLAHHEGEASMSLGSASVRGCSQLLDNKDRGCRKNFAV